MKYPPHRLVNTGTIAATSATNRLEIGVGDTITNTGTLRAGPGATLIINGGLGGGLINVGGLIEADGAGSFVKPEVAAIRGGTLSTRNGGVIEVASLNMNLDGTTKSAIATTATWGLTA